MAFLALVGLDDGFCVNGKLLVRIDDDAEQAGVRLQAKTDFMFTRSQISNRADIVFSIIGCMHRVNFSCVSHLFVSLVSSQV